MSRSLTKTATPGIFRRGNSYIVVVRDGDRRQVKRFADTLAAARVLKAELTLGADRGTFVAGGNGSPPSCSRARRVIFKPAMQRAGVPWASLHSFRHTCASRLFRAGWNAKQVQVVLGHHSPAFTMATYIHLMPEDLPALPASPIVGDEMPDVAYLRRLGASRNPAGA